MKKLWNKWTDIALVKRILVGLILGAILGIAVPGATGIAILGDVFVSALKAIAPLLVFFLVISSLCNAGKSHGGVIKTVIILYMFSTVLAAVIAVFASMAFPVKLTLATAATTDAAAPQGIVEVLNNLLLNLVANPVSSLVNANYVGILMWAILLGLAFRAANNMTQNVLKDIADGISTVVTWIINMAPFGIFGLVFNTVSTNGLDIFTTYGKLLLLLVGCMLFIYFVTNPLLVYWCIRKNPYPLIFHCLKRSALTAFFTRSSAANIPVNMKVCEEMGLDRDTYSVTIPLGATINMDGAAITITVMTMATAFTLGIHVDIPTAIILSLLAALSACGASGVAGGSLLLIPMACCMLGSLLMGILYCFLTVTLRANQNVTGLAMTTFGVGFGNFFGGSISKLAGGVGQISVKVTGSAYTAKIPGLSKIPVIGGILFNYGFLTYLCIIIAVLLSFFLFKTRAGLNLRAIGENPGTADAAGINVIKYKYLSTCIGAGLAGLGGLYFVMEYSGGTWTDNGFGDRGWLAVALVIFALWKPLNAIWGAFLFGALYILYLYIPGLGRSMQEVFKALPYVVTIIVLVFTSFRKKKEHQPPAALGLPYFREER